MVSSNCQASADEAPCQDPEAARYRYHFFEEQGSRAKSQRSILLGTPEVTPFSTSFLGPKAHTADGDKVFLQSTGSNVQLSTHDNILHGSRIDPALNLMGSNITLWP